MLYHEVTFQRNQTVQDTSRRKQSILLIERTQTDAALSSCRLQHLLDSVWSRSQKTPGAASQATLPLDPKFAAVQRTIDVSFWLLYRCYTSLHLQTQRTLRSRGTLYHKLTASRSPNLGFPAPSVLDLRCKQEPTLAQLERAVELEQKHGRPQNLFRRDDFRIGKLACQSVRGWQVILAFGKHLCCTCNIHMHYPT